MKNYAAYILSITTIIAVGFGFSSCKDDEPAVKPKLSFTQSTMTVNEGDGTIDVELMLDKGHGKDLTIEYTLGGTASDQSAVGTATADYEVVGDPGVVVIGRGQTSASIQLKLYSDTGYEPDETIEISILDVNTSDIELTTEDETVVTITNDDAPLVASFGSTSLTVNEADGATELLRVTVQLDKPAPADVIIKYTLTGTAFDSTFAHGEEYPASYYDYYINNGPAGELVVPSGQSSADIEIQLYTDFMFENDETIIITLTGTGATQPGTNSAMTITVKQQDGRVIALVWEEAYTNVDMDMFLWFGDDTTNLDGLLAAALTPQTTPQQEIIFVPSLITAGAFGLSCTYYSGTANPMNFEVHYVDFAAGALEAEATREIFPATYTLANINAWDQSDVQPVIVQKFSIEAGAYKYITQIKVPGSGSRMKTYKLPPGTRRFPGLSPDIIF